jgi:diguanylate cyclase
LNRFPIDALKIDQSFVQQIVAAPSDAPIVSAVIRMAKSLKQRVIAEGVETSDQAAFLVAEECTEGQGFYFSRPMPASQLVESMFLRSDGRAGLRQTDALPHAQRRVS